MKRIFQKSEAERGLVEPALFTASGVLRSEGGRASGVNVGVRRQVTIAT